MSEDYTPITDYLLPSSNCTRVRFLHHVNHQKRNDGLNEKLERVLNRDLRESNATINSVHWAQQGDRFVTAGEDRTVKIWSTKILEAQTGEDALLATIDVNPAIVNCVRFSPCGTMILTGDSGKDVGGNLGLYTKSDVQSVPGIGQKAQVENWVRSAKYSLEENIDLKLDVQDVAWSPNGRMIAASFLCNIVLVAEITSSKQILSTVKLESLQPSGIAWNPSSTTLVCQRCDGGLDIWDTKNWVKKESFPDAIEKRLPFGSTRTNFWRISFSPESKSLLAINRGYKAKNKPEHGILVLGAKQLNVLYFTPTSTCVTSVISFCPILFVDSSKTEVSLMAVGCSSGRISIWGSHVKDLPVITDISWKNNDLIASAGGMIVYISFKIEGLEPLRMEKVDRKQPPKPKNKSKSDVATNESNQKVEEESKSKNLVEKKASKKKIVPEIVLTPTKKVASNKDNNVLSTSTEAVTILTLPVNKPLVKLKSPKVSKSIASPIIHAKSSQNSVFSNKIERNLLPAVPEFSENCTIRPTASSLDMAKVAKKDNNGLCILSVYFASKLCWELEVNRISLVAISEKYTAFVSRGYVTVCSTKSGRIIWSNIFSPNTCMLILKDEHLLIANTHGSLKLILLTSAISVYTCELSDIAITPEQIVSVDLLRDGVLIVNFVEGVQYMYSVHLKLWHKVKCSSEFFKSSFYNSADLKPEELVAIKNSSVLEKQSATISHLEIEIQNALVVDSSSLYKKWFLVYVRYLCGIINQVDLNSHLFYRLQEIINDWISDNANGVHNLGIDRVALLKETLEIVDSNKSLKELAVKINECLLFNRN